MLKRRRFVTASVLLLALLALPRGVASAAPAGSLLPVGSASALTLGEGGDRLVSVALTSSGTGAWAAAANGTVLVTGDAAHFGDLVSVGGTGTVVDLVPSASGAGYWLFTREGGVFSFGDAIFYGANPTLDPVVAATRTVSGAGYWTVTGRGTVTAYGDAAAIGGVAANVVDIVTSPTAGVWTIGADGGVFALGGASFFGSVAGMLGTPVVDGAAVGSGGLVLLTSDGHLVPLGAATSPGTATPPPGTVATAFDLTTDGAGAQVATGPARVWRHALIDLPAGSGNGRRIVYANGQQQVWIVDDANQVVRTYLVSGRKATPWAGSYRVQSKSPKAWAKHGGIWMVNMVRFNGGIGFHEIPRYPNGAAMQVEGQLGTHLSSGCVRQAAEDAAFMYGWARVGDLVVVLP